MLRRGGSAANSSTPSSMLMNVFLTRQSPGILTFPEAKDKLVELSLSLPLLGLLVLQLHTLSSGVSSPEGICKRTGASAVCLASPPEIAPPPAPAAATILEEAREDSGSE